MPAEHRLTDGEPVQKVRNNEYCTANDGTKWKRKVKPDGTRTAWEAAAVSASPHMEPNDEHVPGPLLLLLVLQNQAEGEPKHWLLFVGREGEPGTVYMVTGDATFMHYVFSQNERALESPDYHTSCVVARLEDKSEAAAGEATVRRCAELEAPPRAEDRASVRENCQGWTVRVLRRLQQEDVVDEKWVKMAEGLQEPV